MGDGINEGIDGPPYFSERRISGESLRSLDRVTMLAAYRILAGGQLPDAFTLDAVDRFPVEPPDGAVLKFTKSWGGPREYTYTALRCADRWFLSGRKGEVLDWLSLKDRIHNNPCWISTTWAEVPPVEASPFEDMTPAEWHAAMYPAPPIAEPVPEPSTPDDS